jgi:hypothetical protein
MEDDDCVMDLGDEFEEGTENRFDSNDLGFTLPTLKEKKKPSRNGAAETFGSRGSQNALKSMLQNGNSNSNEKDAESDGNSLQDELGEFADEFEDDEGSSPVKTIGSAFADEPENDSSSEPP